MVKKVHFIPGFKQAALVVMGWLSFIAGVFVNAPLEKISLSAIARVLP